MTLGHAPAEAAADEAPATELDGEDGQADEDDAVVVDAAFEARDAALEPVERALTRSLKRALADEQNEVLDTLRRLKEYNPLRGAAAREDSVHPGSATSGSPGRGH